MSDAKYLKLRCLLQREGDLYLAFCIDLSLAVQGDSAEEVRTKLHEQVHDYLNYVERVYREGDRQGAMQLLHRKAPLSTRLRYHMVRAKLWWHNKQQAAQDRPLWKEQGDLPWACQ